MFFKNFIKETANHGLTIYEVKLDERTYTGHPYGDNRRQF
jgi:hypothetical protein